MVKILIAIRSTAQAEALAYALSEHQVYTCHTWPDTIDVLETVCPEIVFIDMSLLPSCDISAFASVTYHPPITIGLTNILSQQIAYQAARAGFHYLALIPIDLDHISNFVQIALKKKSPSLGL